ncbi:MAG: hypothetical protein E6G30_01000 [Actinobacteria bacterium]|nr:MAG: hypothetical protein E6G30_01000 [Actinomycetota bacterium]
MQEEVLHGRAVAREGATGTTVRQLKALKGLGYYRGPVDGSFGDKTETAVKKLQ